MITIDQIKAARAFLDWSQTELAEKAELSQTGIARIENGTNKPNASTLEKIYAAFIDAGIEFIGQSGITKKINIKEAVFHLEAALNDWEEGRNPSSEILAALKILKD